MLTLAGKAVRYWLAEEKIPYKNMLVIVDDLGFTIWGH